ncbi:hypothetical protein ACIBG4_13580 [Nonomuraea sp. NPDC050383]|uniref:hypothetical protein n=1 Tax=Nonomuraea sp. NPDC050383 TaxID=3364362 RepID=UPI00379BD381
MTASPAPPTTARADVHVSYRQLLVAEPGRDHPGSVPNGLTASVPGAAVILTGIHTGVVDVTVRLVATRPPVDTGWDETEEVELVTFTGEIHVCGLMSEHPAALPVLTPQGPGRYGMRVQARGRDLDPAAVPKVPFEFYLVTVWPLDVGSEAAARLGVGVAEELGLPDKSSELRRWAREHGLPQSERARSPRSEPGRAAGLGAPLRLPTAVRGVVPVVDHRVRIVNPFQDVAAPPPLPDGLVAAAPDSLLIRTEKRRGVVGMHVTWQPAAPRTPVRGWEQYEEIEFVTTTGVMRVQGLTAEDGGETNLTPQGAGRYGLRVHGRARDADRLSNRLSNRPGESYLLVVWPVALGKGTQPFMDV